MKIKLILTINMLLAFSFYSTFSIAYDEIQIYDYGINKAGQFGLEMHSNYVIAGRKKPDYLGELPPDGSLAFTAEFSYGLTDQLELGLYVPMSVDTKSNATMVDNAKIRMKWLNAKNSEFFYGLNGEIGVVPKRYSNQPIGMEIRPILGHYDENWLIAFNPTIEMDLTGNDQVPVFSPALKVTHQFIDNINVGFEHYADVGQFSQFATGNQQNHTTYLVSDISIDNYRVHIGVGHGWTEVSDSWMLKIILGGIPIGELFNPNRR